MIKFNTTVELNIIDEYDVDADNITADHDQVFPANQPVDADICDDDGSGYVILQFANGGGVAVGVQRSCFEVIP